MFIVQPTMVPTFIRSADEFHATVQLGSTSESLVLDFKAMIDRTQSTPQEICRDIAQFTNTWGGCLLVGVSERIDRTRRLKVADGIKPVVDLDGLRQWIEQAITNYLVPATLRHDLTPIALQQGNILAVNVPASRHLVALWDHQKHSRVSAANEPGKEWMNPNEAERHLMDGSRAAKLAIHAAKDAATVDEVELVGGI